MFVEFEIPDLSDIANGVSQYRLKTFFIQSPSVVK